MASTISEQNNSSVPAKQVEYFSLPLAPDTDDENDPALLAWMQECADIINEKSGNACGCPDKEKCACHGVELSYCPNGPGGGSDPSCSAGGTKTDIKPLTAKQVKKLTILQTHTELWKRGYELGEPKSTKVGKTFVTSYTVKHRDSNKSKDVPVEDIHKFLMGKIDTLF